jgi:hypothetical protein
MEFLDDCMASTIQSSHSASSIAYYSTVLYLGLTALPSVLLLKFILSWEWTLYKYSRTMMKA